MIPSILPIELSSSHKNVANVSIVYELDTQARDLNTDFTVGGFLIGAVKVTKNADKDIYGYSSYGIGFDAHSYFSLSNGEFGKNVIIFGVDNNSSTHDDNKKALS